MTAYAGSYSLLAGTIVSDLKEIPAGMNGMNIASGKYLVFTARGTMPHSLIQTWAAIWNYFSNSSNYERSYITDFELYRASEEVDIYIAIK